MEFMGQLFPSSIEHNQPEDCKMPLKKKKIVDEDTISLIIVIIIGAVILLITNLFIFGVL